MDGWVVAVAQEAGIEPSEVAVAVTGALRRLHRMAVVDREGLSAAVVEIRLEIGAEACWHLCGLLEMQRLGEPSDLSWSETLMRLDPSLKHYGVLIEKWLQARADPGGNR